MKGDEVRRIREKFDLSREEFAQVFGLSGYRAVANIEIDFRHASRLTIILLRVLDSLPVSKAKAIIDLLRKHSDA